MAEIFGTISAAGGLLAMSTELCEAISQLESFLRRTQDAPRAILRLVSELQTLSLNLRMLEPHRQHDRHDTWLLDSCARACEHSVRRIRVLIDKVVRPNGILNSNIRFALRQKEFRELAEELEHSKSSLMLTIQTYMASELARRRGYPPLASSKTKESFEDDDDSTLCPEESVTTEHLTGLQDVFLPEVNEKDAATLMETVVVPGARTAPGETSRELTYRFSSQIIDQAATTADKSIELIPNHRRILDSTHQGGVAKTNSGFPAKRLLRRYKWRIPIPAWLTTQIWDLSYIHSQGLWNVRLQTHSVVPDHADILVYARTGQVGSTQKLLSQRRASLTDQDACGWKPLWWSIDCGHTELCAYILQNTVLTDPLDLIKPMMGLHCGILTYDIETQRYFWNMLLHQLQDSDIEDFFRDLITGFWPTELKVRKGVTTVDFCIRLLPASWFSRTLSERLLHGLVTASSSCLVLDTYRNLPHRNYFPLMESVDNVAEIAAFESSIGDTYLHCAANWIGQVVRFSPMLNMTARWNEWLRLITAWASNGADLSAIYKGLTPLQRIIWCWNAQFIDANIMQRGLTLWLQALWKAEVSLGAYFERERDLFLELGSSFNYNFDLVFSSVTGDRPDNWKVETSTVSRMEVFRLDNPPGSWSVDDGVPKHICWKPSHAELDEGNWVKVKTQTLVSEPFTVSPLSIESGEYFNILERTQDDHGPIALRATSRKHPALRLRSASQPPSLRRREGAYSGNNIARHDYIPWSHPSGANRYWLTACHICPFDSKLRFDCLPDPDSAEYYFRDRFYTAISLRHCMRGVGVRMGVQETPDWRVWSFEGRARRVTLYDEMDMPAA